MNANTYKPRYKKRPGDSPHFRPCTRCGVFTRDAEIYSFPEAPKVWYCQPCAENLDRMRQGIVGGIR